uniref:Endoplasmic reticulum membrane protein YGL010W n=1 Tax=Pseudodiaptomus poplesia TaxID=213370 RepID=A0A0U2IGC4_9MAXI|nr:endoplasmic reticulum membrane protein YGL010W [Pseudodiaptomus poplesia]
MGGKAEARGFFDLKKQFIFYASYHNDSMNVVIHLFCIWQILYTTTALLQMTPAFGVVPAEVSEIHWSLNHLNINAALLITLVYVVTYVIMDPVAGGIGAALIILVNLHTGWLVSTYTTIGGYPLWQALVAYNVVLWILQFIGHGVFEKRAPALLDSLDQAFITAPLFVLLEILFYFGYRKKFYKDCMKQVEKNISEFKRMKSQ